LASKILIQIYFNDLKFFSFGATKVDRTLPHLTASQQMRSIDDGQQWLS
jgi:hypothetical protein